MVEFKLRYSVWGGREELFIWSKRKINSKNKSRRKSRKMINVGVTFCIFCDFLHCWRRWMMAIVLLVMNMAGGKTEG